MHGIVAGGVVACLLAAPAVGVSASNAPETLIGSGFELLDVVEAAGDPMGTVRTAADAESFQRLWADAAIATPPPFSVDFDDSVVVSFTIPDDACPPVLTGFDRAGDVWTPQFVDAFDMCVLPLIPKIYVVAVERATLPDTVTFHLPAEPLYFDTAGSATLQIADPAASPTSIDSGASTSDAAPAAPAGEFPAPELGQAVSVLLDDGFPLWLVRHQDGTVSALPGLVEAPSTPMYPAESTVGPVAWLEDARRFSGRATHDEWGRALNDGRHTDLTGYVATLVDGQVHVVVDDRAIPGQPFFDGPREITGFAQPTLRTTTIAQLQPGWWQIDINVITTGGESRLCANADPTPCPPGAPLVPHGGEVDTGTVLWQEGPVIIHQTAEGTIDDLAILGGSGRTSQ